MKNVRTTDDAENSTMTRVAPSTAGTTTDRTIDESVDALHRVCGVYTMPAVAGTILDAIGWRDDADLSNLRLLEPAAGNGEFVVQAGKRLVASCRRQGIEPTTQLLVPRIAAFELHVHTASEARLRVRVSLQTDRR